MSKRSSDHDFATVARRVVEQAIGEQLDGSPLGDSSTGKNPVAIARGKAGGAKGGTARAAKLTAEERRKIAARAAKVRWSKKTT